MPELSIVTPVYRCEQCLVELCDRLHKTLGKISSSYEIILVNDGSPDSSWSVIEELSVKDRRVKGIKLSRNFGQHYAITAGLSYAKGRWIVVMDCDLQDRPEEIRKLYDKATEGYDLVVGVRESRRDNWFKKLTSRFFYHTYAYFTDSRVINDIGNFGIYHQKVIGSIMRLKEQTRSFGLFAIWVGFKRTEINIVHDERACGSSSYSFSKRLNLALDSIVSHSNKLMYLAIKIGFGLSVLAFTYGTWLVARYFLWSIPVPGWTSTIVAIHFTAGLIISSIGIIGLYIAKIFDEVKGRPLFVIDKTTFQEDALEE